MRKLKFLNLLLAVSLALAPLVAWAQTKPKNNDLSISSMARMNAAPIGSIESMEALQINGSAAGRQTLLWNGDVVQTSPTTPAQVLLASIGNLTLRGGSAVKFVADPNSQALVATMIEGEMSVSLKPQSSAKLEIAGTTYVTTRGAQFRAGVRDHQPVVIATSGQMLQIGNFGLGLYDKEAAMAAAAQQQVGPRKYLIKPLNLGTNTEIRARSTRNLQVRVTDENDRPVPDAPVLFLLGSGGGSGSGGAGTLAGQASFRAMTNSQGVAEVNFTATNAGTNTKIKVQVEGTDAVWEGTISVLSAQAGFWSPQNSVPIFSVLGAAAGLGIYKAVTRDPVRVPNQIDTRTGGTVVLP
jgi:hypothetical protein